MPHPLAARHVVPVLVPLPLLVMPQGVATTVGCNRNRKVVAAAAAEAANAFVATYQTVDYANFKRF